MASPNSTWNNGVGAVTDENLNAFLQSVANIPALRSFIGVYAAGVPMTVSVLGSVTPNDGGGGVFYWQFGNGFVDDGSSTIVPSGYANGAWLKLSPYGSSLFGTFANVAALENAFLPNSVTTVIVYGYYTPGDGGGAQYKRSTSAGPGPGLVQSRDGTWWILVGPDYNVRMFGAKGDGTADDTAAFQAAANSGLSFWVPQTTAYFRLSSRITLTTNGQSIAGYGNLSKIQQTGVDNNAEIFFFNGSSNNSVSGCNLIPGSTSSGNPSTGAAILFSGCTNASAVNNEISGHVRGIIFSSCLESKAVNNYIHDSPVWTTPTSSFGTDIGTLANCTGIVIADNVLRNGAGEGIGVETHVTTGQTVENIAITGNVIDGEGSYGIIVYSDGANAAGPNPDVFDNITITGNSIQNITGLNPNPFDGLLDYGTGIYIQGVEGVVIDGNNLKNTNLNTSNELLSPAAIAVGNARRVTITGNSIVSPNYYGIELNDINNKGDPNGVATVTGNVIEGAVKNGIYCKCFPSAIITGNTVTGGAQNGLSISDASALVPLSADFKITSNVFSNNGGSGINAEAGAIFAANNTCQGNAVSGIVIESPENCVVTGNLIQSNTLRGLYYNPSAVTDNSCMAMNNVFDSNPIQVLTNGPLRYVTQNVFRNPIASGAGAIQGTYATNGIANNMSGATPSVQAASLLWTKTDTVALTNMTNGYPGQIVTIQATGGDFVVTYGTGTTIVTTTKADVTVLNGTTISFMLAGIWRQI